MKAKGLILICMVAFFACTQTRNEEERKIDTIEKFDNPLFTKNCASCHNPFKDATGPAFGNITEQRTPDWIFKFVTNRKSLSKDTAFIHLMKTSEISCPEFPALTKEEVQRIFNFTH